MLPRVAELYRQQIGQGVGSDSTAAEARTILRDMFGEIVLSPGDTGSVGVLARTRGFECKARKQMVGATGFEPATLTSRRLRKSYKDKDLEG